MSKKQLIYNLKLAELAKIGKVKVSKSGNHYVEKGDGLQQHINICKFTCNKSNIDKIGTSFTIPDKSQTVVVLLTKTGKVLICKGNSKFHTLSKKLVLQFYSYLGEGLINLFLIGKKIEWMKNYTEKIEWLRYYNFLKSFSSLKSALVFLNYTSELHGSQYSRLGNLIEGYRFKNKESLLEINDDVFITDTIRMIRELDKPHYYDSPAKIENLHDTLIYEYNLQSIASKSELVTRPNYELKWELIEELDYTFLDTEKKLFTEGLKMKHCVSSYSGWLMDYYFLHIEYEGKGYTAQLSKERIHQVKGVCNQYPPGYLMEVLSKLYK